MEVLEAASVIAPRPGPEALLLNHVNARRDDRTLLELLEPYNIRFMGDRSFPGEFEHMVLAAVIRLGDGAYGASILEEIGERTGRRVSSGSLYVTLDRLERKGLLRSHTGEPEPGRGGRPKRFVSVTPQGLTAVRDVRRAMLNLWAGIEGRLEEA